MRITAMMPVEMEASAIRCMVPIRYDDDLEEQVKGTAWERFLTGRTLEFDLDLDTGAVRGWPEGQAARLHTKPCDEGSYYLLGADGERLAAIEQYYVPSCVPGEYGDYFVADVGGDGRVSGWRPSPGTVARCFWRAESE